MNMLNKKNVLSILGAIALSTTTASAATFALDLSGGTSTTLPASTYSLSTPILPHAIIDFQGDGTGAFDSFGGLEVIGGDSNTRLTYTYLGSEAGASNTATLNLGADSFANDGSTAVGASFTTGHFASFVDLTFSTNLGGAFSIDNREGSSTSSDLHLAFSDITGDASATSVYAFFGDGAGDNDFDDMAIRIDISQVPLPAGGLLLISALGGLAVSRRARSKS